jgi:peptidoglycan/LPS O-acetylase OafA/YrhL
MHFHNRYSSTESEGSIPAKPPHAHIEGFDLIRLAAALIVVFYHFAYWNWHECACVDARFPSLVPYSWWGWIGVPIFFVISGFVIALSAEGRTANDFLRGRLLRIAPGLWFFATLGFLILVLTNAMEFPAAAFLLVKSFVLWPIGPWVDGVYWSLTVEVLFYSIVFMLLAGGCFKWLSSFATVWLLLTTLFALTCAVDLFWHYPQPFGQLLHTVRDSYASRYLLLTSGPYFLMGLAIYFIYRQGMTFGRTFMLAGSFLAAEISIYFSSLEMRPQDTEVSLIVPGLVFAVGTFAIVVSVAMSKAPELHSRGRGQMIKLLGLASYPLYLVHFVTGRWIATSLLAMGLHKGLAIGLSITLCLAVSLLFVYAFEGRLRRWLAASYDRLALMAERIRPESFRDAERRA